MATTDTAPNGAKSRLTGTLVERIDAAKATVQRSRVAMKRSRDLIQQSREALRARNKHQAQGSSPGRG